MKNIVCFCSSFLFLFNSIIAYKYKYYNYSLSLLFLTITSLFHHCYSTKITRIIDLSAIITVVYYNIKMFNIKRKNNSINFLRQILCILLFFFIKYVYLYGYYSKKFCFSNKKSSRYWHSLIHIMAFTGHIILILSE